MERWADNSVAHKEPVLVAGRGKEATIMELASCRRRFVFQLRSLLTIACSLLLVPGDTSLLAQSNPAGNAAGAEESVRIPPDQLDSLVAPIALYPDPLLSQTLVASTYPLEIIQLQQWLSQNKNLKDKALADAAKKQDWDPSIQALAALPDVVKLLSENVKWTTDLGNAFLAQQSDVMDAVQRMRQKAQSAGNLKSSEQQKVETKVVENKQVVVIQQSSECGRYFGGADRRGRRPRYPGRLFAGENVWIPRLLLQGFEGARSKCTFGAA